MNTITILSISILVLLIASLVPIGTYWVDDLWVYGYDNYSDYVPGMNKGYQSVWNGQTMKLNTWQYFDAKRNNAIMGKYVK